ncbi:MAG: hypothetical protein PHG66_00460 [Candidatus Colwellbacteria bacterium]|nr:hypothetical protein [Candidatus Colwellbacteria bacterium]
MSLDLLTPNLSLNQVQNLVTMQKCSVHDRSEIGETCLHIQNDPEVVQYLLEQGANANAKTKMGNTPLHYKKCPEVVKLLLIYGSSPNAVNLYGNTPLHKQTDDESVRLLLKFGASRWSKNLLGKNPHEVNVNVPNRTFSPYFILMVLFIVLIIKYVF